MQTWFLDKLAMHQNHQLRLPRIEVELDVLRPLPRVGAFARTLTEVKTGELVSDTVTSETVEGSYKTSLQLRCDGSTVQMSGNPSKFGRLDNLFGYRRIKDAVSLFNVVLARFDLPPFTPATYYEPSQEGGDKAKFFTDGAIITHFDLTTNHAVGSERNVLPALRAFSTYTSGRKIPNPYPNGRTVDWKYKDHSAKGSEYLYSKLYDKYHEMMLHKCLYELTFEEMVYLESLREYIRANGVIREEHSLKSKFLKRHGAYIYGMFDETKLNELFLKVRDMFNKTSSSVADYETIGEKLFACDACSQSQAHRMQDIVYAWMSGADIQARYKNKSTFYQHRNLLLPYGIDIKLKFDISRMNHRIKVIELKPLAVPDFYRHAC